MTTPTQHLDWFRDDRGIIKWWNPANGTVMPTRDDPEWNLACQISFAARFDRPSLEVETLRYFHDDDAVGDVFAEENATMFSARLIRDIGLFLVPAARTWDRTGVVRVGAVSAGWWPPAKANLPNSVLSERDRLRVPHETLEADERLAPIVERLNQELGGFFRTAPTLHLRVTATDSDGLLESVGISLCSRGCGPCHFRRGGTEAASCRWQHLLLLLQFGRMRAESGEGFWMAP